MRPRSLARVLVMGGMSAVSAVLAHGGATGLRSPAWLAGAAAGSLLVALAVAVAARYAATLRARLERIAAGDLRTGDVDADPALALSVAVATALACQGGAHAGLLLLGVHAHAGAAGAPALHVLLGFLAAIAVYGLDRVLGRLQAAVERAVGVALALLLPVSVQLRPAPGEVPRTRMAARRMGSRAPPIAA
jgi:hypothetical protein